MKKSVIFSIVIISAFLMMSSTMIFAVETPVGDITIEKKTPTVDGNIANDEWGEAKIVMDKSNSEAWAGEVTGTVDFYCCWNDDGLFVAADITDNTFSPSDIGNPTSKDLFQIALNPSGLIENNAEGIFFSFALNKNNVIETERHNYSAGLITDKVKASGIKNDKGWSLEAFIPWSEINVLSSKFIPTNGAFLNSTICYVDRTANAEVTNAYKTMKNDMNSSSFQVETYPIRFVLSDSAAESVPQVSSQSSSQIMEVSSQDTSDLLSSTASSNVQENRSSGNLIIIVVIILIVILAFGGIFLFRKIRVKK